jgi:1,2-diacylglycerol 3-beta-galactosyltransferase
MTTPRPTIDLVWFAAGGGHRAAAQALQQSIVEQGRPWNVRPVNLVEVLDPKALFERTLGFAPEDIYNKRLATGFTIGLAQELKLLQAGIRLAHRALVQRLAAHWAATQPDLVVSLIPNFNRALHDALALARPEAPFVTVMTDMADHPPNFWIEPDTAQHIVCGTGHAVAQAMAAGVPEHRIHRVDGMVLRPAFHRDRAAAAPGTALRGQLRQAAGLPAEGAVGLVLFGGTGSRAMRRIERELHDLPLVLMCGRNAELAEALRKQAALAAPGGGPRAARTIVGFTTDVAHWMRLADFFVGKPGPGSISEAVQCGLPAIVTCNAMTMPQERWNTRWVREQGVGVVLRRYADVRAAAHRIAAELPQWRERVQAIRNDAVHQVPAVIAERLAAAQALRQAQAWEAQLRSLQRLPAEPVHEAVA